MAGLGSITTTLITTRGLFTIGEVLPPGFTALTFGAGITPWFRLYIANYTPPVVAGGSNGGSRVYQPGEFADSLKYINPETGQPMSEPWFVVPRDKEHEYFNKGRIVKIEIVFGGKTMEKIYSVNEKHARTIIEVANIFNATKARIHITIGGVKRLATTALVEVRNLVLRRKPTK